MDKEPGQRPGQHLRIVNNTGQPIHARSRRTYGAPRVRAALRAQGVCGAHKRVARLLRAAALAGCDRRRVRTTIADPAQTSAPNLVARDFAAAVPHRL